MCHLLFKRLHRRSGAAGSFRPAVAVVALILLSLGSLSVQWPALCRAGARTAPTPFDLVWSNTDENLIPLNPQWGWQLDHPGQSPDVNALCGGRPYASPCTTQSPSFDAPPPWSVSSYTCARNPRALPWGDGPSGGHANWMAATVEGTVTWAGRSHPRFGDDNYRLRLSRSDNAALTSGNGGTMALGFGARETVDHFTTPWWTQLRRAVEAGNGSAKALVDGKTAIVTGLLGINGAHSGQTELHPVYALAIRVNDDPADETWAIFVRNWGNEGWCSQDTHYLDLRDSTYTFRLPWRGSAAGFSVRGDRTVFRTNGAAASGPDVGPDPGRSVLVSFHLPAPDTNPRVHGELHLKWNVGGPAGGTVSPPAPPAGGPIQPDSMVQNIDGAVDQHLASADDANLLDLAAQMTPTQRQTLQTALPQPMTTTGSRPSRGRVVSANTSMDNTPLNGRTSTAFTRGKAPGQGPPHVRAVLDRQSWTERWDLRQRLEQAFGGTIPGISPPLPPLPAREPPSPVQ